LSKKQYIDYNHIPEGQEEMHARLSNWARWIRSGSREWACHPMWKPCIVKEEEMLLRNNREIKPKEPIMIDDAVAIERAVAALPDKHRKAIRWNYVFQHNPLAACKAIAVSKEELARLVKDGRQMLINRERLLAKAILM
jgi:DNA-directed RNA polymerase specialized sigma24 family protein